MKVGVIGTGHMGENHVRTYISLQDHCQLIGIYDDDESRSRHIANQYKVKHFQSITDLLKSVDAVSIAVPTESHYEIGLMCIKHNVHLLMEKPITSTVAQAEDLNQKAIAAGVKLQVGHIELFNPLIKTLKKELQNTDVIAIDFRRMSLNTTRNQNIDVVKELMIHDFYIFQDLLKDQFLAFYVLGSVTAHTPKHATVLFESPQGVIAQLTASFKSKRKIRTIHIFTNDALFEVDILNNDIKITRDTDIRTISVTDDKQPLTVQLLDFINCIKFNRPPSVSGTDGINTLRITNKVSDAIYKSQS